MRALAIIPILAICGVAWLVGVARVNQEKNITKLVRENRLSVDETTALRACGDQFAGKSLTEKSATGSITNFSVPDQICVCQAKRMAAVMKPDHYGEHRIVVEYAVSHKGSQSLDPESLRSPNNDGAAAFRNLSNWLEYCVTQYVTERRHHTAERLAEIRRPGR